jgi:hypothetical protein
VSEPIFGREGRNSTNRSAPATAVCPVCNKRFERGRHRNQFHRAEARIIESSRYCSPKCRQSAWRTRRDIRNGIPRSQRPIRNKRQKQDAVATTLHASVTRSKNLQRFQCAAAPQKTTLGTLQRAKLLSSHGIVAPADVLAVEVFDRTWKAAVSSDGIAIEVSRLRARALVS